MDREGEVFNQRGGRGGEGVAVFFFSRCRCFLRTKCVFGSVENIGIHKTPRIFFIGGWWGWFLCDILFWRENSIDAPGGRTQKQFESYEVLLF